MLSKFASSRVKDRAIVAWKSETAAVEAFAVNVEFRFNIMAQNGQGLLTKPSM